MAGQSTALGVSAGAISAFQAMAGAIEVCKNNYTELQIATQDGTNISIIKSSEVSLKAAALAAQGASAEFLEMGASQQVLKDSAEKSNSALGGLVKKFATLDNLKAVMDLSDTMVNNTARLDFMNDGLQTTEELNNMIFESAKRSRTSYLETANTVAELGARAKGAFSGNQEMVAFSEMLSKMYTVAGAGQQEAGAATAQLTDALSSGVVSGAQFEEIFATAPNIMQAVADYMNVPIDQLQNMADEGALTGEAVKEALLSTANVESVNETFSAMPMTWAQVVTQIKDEALSAFQPILEKVNEIANSEQFQSMLTYLTNGLDILAAVAVEAFDLIGGVATLVYDNWYWLGPLVYGVVAALGVYYAATSGVKAVTMAVSAATKAWGVAQGVLSTIMAMNPIVLIIFAIIALIAVVYAVVGVINHFAGTTLSAAGIIMGAFAAVGAFIFNAVIGVLNAVIQYIWTSAEPIIGIIEWILNAANGGFNSFGGAVANLIGQIISWFLSLGKVVTKIIDAIFGTNWTEGLNALQDKVLGWGKNDTAITINRDAPTIDTRIDYGDAYNTGYKFGEGIDNKISGFFSKDTDETDIFSNNSYDTYTGNSNAMDALQNIDNNTASGAESTDRIADAMEITEEDLKYLRDIAEREIIDRTVFKSLNVDLGGVANTVNNMSDLDGIAEYLGDVISQTASASMEGV
ncbi:tape measure protein [Konateibacter massiliensis]|uniref:tape measure protein n=1 Tax=Konateibacter massiliensis TaxID=2002841 RepID=UPI000C149109|nr:tape measure protein [Konateibacter massiliensis]